MISFSGAQKRGTSVNQVWPSFNLELKSGLGLPKPAERPKSEAALGATRSEMAQGML
jgi:hypothetical protein